MATYRRLLPADAAVTSALWNRANVQTMLVNNGYPGVENEDWLAALNHPRVRVYGAFDNAGTLRGFAEFVLHRERREGFCGRWCIDPSLSLNNIRTHRNEILKALWNALPDDWVVFWINVPVGAVRIREYFTARPSVPFVDRPAMNEWPAIRDYGPITAQLLKAAA